MRFLLHRYMKEQKCTLQCLHDRSKIVLSPINIIRKNIVHVIHSNRPIEIKLSRNNYSSSLLIFNKDFDFFSSFGYMSSGALANCSTPTRWRGWESA